MTPIKNLIALKDFDTAKIRLEEYVLTASGAPQERAQALLTAVQLVDAPDEKIVEFLAKISPEQFAKLQLHEDVELVPNQHLSDILTPRFYANSDTARRMRSDSKSNLRNDVEQNPTATDPEPEVVEDIVLTVDQAKTLLEEKGLKSQFGLWTLIDDSKFVLLGKQAKKGANSYRKIGAPIFFADFGVNRQQRQKLERLRESLRGVELKKANKSQMIEFEQKHRLALFFAGADKGANSNLRAFVEAYSYLLGSVLKGKRLETEILETYKKLNNDPRVKAALAKVGNRKISRKTTSALEWF